MRRTGSIVTEASHPQQGRRSLGTNNIDARHGGLALAVPLRVIVAAMSGQQGAVTAVVAAVFSRVVAITVESSILATCDDGLPVSGTRAAAKGDSGRR